MPNISDPIMKMSLLLAVYISVLPGCKEPPPGSTDATVLTDGSDPAMVKCGASSTTTYSPLTKVLSGVGIVTCDSPARLSVDVCLHVKAMDETSWGDPVQCKSSGGTDLRTLTVETEVRVSVGAPKHYRTVVRVHVNGVDQPPQISDTLTAP